jgi:pimeloyl-ACP methyl ester carboxylesterase
MIGRARAWASVLVLPALACSGESGAEGRASGLTWHDCLDGAECATLAVPNDHVDPAGAKQEMAVARAAASERNGRIGSLLFNFGGPGVPSVEAVPALARWFSQNAPEVRARFDLVGFDPRGIGESTPKIDCVADVAMDRIRALPPTFSEADRGLYDLLGDEILDGCGSFDGAFMSHIDTESVARDIELLREALGESAVSYFGGSYGTLLGATYATLFPERVRAFLLDSPVTPSWNRQEILVGQAGGYEAALAAFFDWCAGEGSCVFGPAADAAEVALAFDDLMARAMISPLLAEARALTAFDLQLAVGSALLGGSDSWPALAEMLAGADGGDASLLLEMADDFYERNADGSYGPIVDAYMAIAALDAPFPEALDREAYDAFVQNEVFRAGPRLGPGFAVGERLTVGWPFRRETPSPEIHAPTAPPMLLLAGRNDPATPLRWGEALRSALDNGSHLVTVDGFSHGQLFVSVCAQDLAERFLVDPSAVDEDSECP